MRGRGQLLGAVMRHGQGKFLRGEEEAVARDRRHVGEAAAAVGTVLLRVNVGLKVCRRRRAEIAKTGGEALILVRLGRAVAEVTDVLRPLGHHEAEAEAGEKLHTLVDGGVDVDLQSAIAGESVGEGHSSDGRQGPCTEGKGRAQDDDVRCLYDRKLIQARCGTIKAPFPPAQLLTAVVIRRGTPDLRGDGGDDQLLAVIAYARNQTAAPIDGIAGVTHADGVGGRRFCQSGATDASLSVDQVVGENKLL